MRKFCFAAIVVMIAAGCGDAPSSSPDPESVEAETSTTASTETLENASEETPAPDAKPTNDVAEAAVAGTEAAADDVGKPEVSSIETELTAINDEYNEKMKAFQEWYSSASAEDKQENFRKHYPDAEEFAGRFMTLATDSPEDPAAVTALARAANLSRGDIAAKASSILFEKHANHDAVADVVPMLGYNTGEETEKALRSLLKKTTNERVKGLATLTLAQYLSRAAQTKQLIADNPDAAEYYAKEAEYLEAFETRQRRSRRLVHDSHRRVRIC